ncbi:MAG: penicillin acylase family protein [Chloroflexi bacterium]|nr:penicillin acylase family protein [Chloroflexota bacterium]
MTTTAPKTLDQLRQEARRRMPPLEGTLALKGLDGPVRIMRDKHGVPHAQCASTHDMWFAQGFLHAQERLWGMERTRRFFHGTLSEVIGEGTLNADRLYRRVGLMRAAHREWPHLEQAGREVAQAYAAGVNAYLDQGYPLPVEFEILGYEPAPWEPVDVTGRWKLIAYSQSMNGQLKLSRLQLLHLLGPRLFVKLFPFYPTDAPTMSPMAEPAGQRPLAELLKLYEEAHAQAGILFGTGSNNWAVDGTMTLTGKPLLAGDPHLAITVPCFWQVQHIVGPQFAFIGASMPGVPGVTYYGHNGHTAWSVTTAGADAQDLFLERVRDGDPPTYLYQGQWVRASVHVERIRVKGQAEPVVERIIETHHGPVVSGGPGGRGPAVALRWSGDEVQQTFSSFVPMHAARNIDELIEAHRQWTSHTNRVLADTAGGIAYLLSGQLPLRKGGPAHLPVPGWTGQHEWVGQVPFDEMPRAVNPPSHFVNTSNNLIAGYGFPHYIAPAGAPYRAMRVREMLTDGTPATPEKFGRMHADNLSIPGARMAQRIRRVQPATPLGRQALELLAAWDGFHRLDAAGGAVYEVLRWKLYQLTLGTVRTLLPDPKPGDDSLHVYLAAIEALAIADDNELLTHQAFPLKSWDAILATALDAAAEHLSKTLGFDSSQWAWGRLHSINMRHGIGREEPAASLLNAGDFPFGGSGDTVNNAGHEGGPSFSATSIPTYRQIIDLADLNNSLFIIPPGNSGLPASPHYADHMPDYLNVRYRPLLWDWRRIEAEKETEQRLEPQG